MTLLASGVGLCQMWILALTTEEIRGDKWNRMISKEDAGLNDVLLLAIGKEPTSSGD